MRGGKERKLWGMRRRIGEMGDVNGEGGGEKLVKGTVRL